MDRLKQLSPLGTLLFGLGLGVATSFASVRLLNKVFSPGSYTPLEEDNEHYFSVTDGTRLYESKKYVSGAKTLVVFSHGMSDHIGNFEDLLGAFFNDKGISTYFLDCRGHGKSEGKRNTVKEINEFAQDLLYALKFRVGLDQFENVFLMGHSFGSTHVLNSDILSDGLINTFFQVKGMILLSPFLSLDGGDTDSTGNIALKKLIANAVNKFVPNLPISPPLPFDKIAKNEEWVEEMKKDELRSKTYYRVETALGLLNGLEKIEKNAEKIKTPLLIIHSKDDKITSQKVSENFFERITIPDKKYIKIEGVYHDILHEEEKDDILGDVLDFIEERS